MTAPKPPPRTLQPAEERKVQLFLERAAPIVLEDPHLTAHRWQHLAALANELDLTADQFRSTIDDLLNRGVLKGLEVTPPKPPPLPGHPRTTTAATTIEGNSPEDFALSPPDSPPVQKLSEQMPAPPQKSPSVPKPPPAHNGADHASAPVTGAAPPVALERSQSAREQFLEQATAILTEQRGLNAKSQSLLATAAQKIGLSEAAAREALQSLYQSAEVVAADEAVVATTEKATATRWRVEGAPAPVPPPPPKTPSQTFLDFARPSLAAARDGIVSAELEQRLIAHGSRVLGLSAVYARHLLLDLIAERKLRLASAAEAPPPVVAAGAAVRDDPRLAEFLQAAKPILAQHRGLNAHSRMLINSMARERGLTEQEVDSAIGSLTTREPGEPIDRALQERLAPFRLYVESGLKKASRGILTPALSDKFVTAGIELFGLNSELATAAVLEVTDKLQLAIITHEQAERHLTNLLQEMLPANTELTRHQRDRIELEGAQWGLQPPRVKDLIAEYCRRNALQVRTEERITRWALSGAVVAIVLVIAFFIWTAIAGNRRVPSPSGVTTAAPTRPSALETKSEASWLDADSDLAISVVNARTDFPIMRRTWIDLSSNDVTRRNSAYDAIVEYFLHRAAEEVRRKQLAEILSLCIAKDPVDDSAGRLLTALLHDVPGPSDDFPQDAGTFGQMFWGVRVVAAALSHAKGQVPRISQIVAALHRAIGITPDPSLPASELEQLCLRNLSERLFRSLITAAGGSLANAAALHAVLVREATRYLDAARLDKFNAEFLTAALTKEPTGLRSFEDLLRFTSASRDPLAVLRLVELYEATESSELREFLRHLLLARTPGTPPGGSVEEIATFVRQGLGVTDAHDPDGVWTKLSREVRGVLANATAPPEPTTPLLADVLQFAHHATLACAFAQNEWSNAAVVELRKAGSPAPDAGLEVKSDDPGDGTRSTPSATVDRATSEALRITIAALRRSQPNERLTALESLARLVDEVPDLPPDMAVAVASHLVGNKSNSEHARVLQHLPSLAKWNQLLVALADRVEDASLTHEQLTSLLNTVLGGEHRLTEGKGGRATARRELWQFIMRRLATTETANKRPVNASENAARLLASAYATQARLLGVPLPEPVVQARDPQATLRILVDEFMSRLAAAKLSDAQREVLAQFPHELTAMEFVSGTNDVHRLASLERIWLRLLVLEVARRNETREGEARELVVRLQQKDLQAKHVLSQLRDGQAALLQMWMLIGRRG